MAKITPSINYEFYTPATSRDLRAGIDFLAAQDLSYPDYRQVWVPKVEHECISGWKTIILARTHGVVIGDVVFQQHKGLARVREIKNLRIYPDFRDRFFAAFLLKQAEKEKPEDYDAIVADVRENQPEIVRFMLRQGYRVIAVQSLYEKDRQEVILAKAKNRDYDIFSLAA